MVSAFSETKPRLRPAIGIFIGQLATKCVQVDRAVENRDFEEIRKFGQWLKTYAGTVGFPAFSEPAEDLEAYADQEQLDSVRHTFGVIKQLNDRIVTPDNAGAKLKSG